MRTYAVSLIRLVCLISLVYLSGCLVLDDTGSGTESGSNVVADPSQQPSFDPTRTICDPFKTNSPQAQDRGLFGNLLYLTDDQPRYATVSDYINNAHIADALIYLDRLFTPTRPFDRGFYTQSGDLVTNINGTTLYEYFALRLQAQLQLAANENPGYYQLAVLADDGALLKIPDGNGGERIIVDNDGTHPTKMACATEPIYLDRDTKIPMIMEYYQGPRYHISLVAMWRPWPDGVNDTNPVNDYYCGRQGNSLYFDSTKDPVESKTAFYELLSRNWKVLENENYFFPQQEVNPCVPAEETLAISAYSITNIQRDRVTLVWTTNVASTSQGESKNVSTNVITPSNIDTNLVQSHSLTITGLLPNTLYAVRAISTTPGGQTAYSDERAFRTPR